MTEDNRSSLRDEIAAFVDRVLLTEAWEESGAEVADRIMRMLADSAPPAPRVFFPGDAVPGDVPMACLVNTPEGRFVGLLEAHGADSVLSTHIGPVIELRGVPSPEEWQAAVARAGAERAIPEPTEGQNRG